MKPQESAEKQQNNHNSLCEKVLQGDEKVLGGGGGPRPVLIDKSKKMGNRKICMNND